MTPEKLSTTTLAALKEIKRRRHPPLVFILCFMGLAKNARRHSATPATPIAITFKGNRNVHKNEDFVDTDQAWQW